eukprot:5664009-Prymnesium_polylepis.1
MVLDAVASSTSGERGPRSLAGRSRQHIAEGGDERRGSASGTSFRCVKERRATSCGRRGRATVSDRTSHGTCVRATRCGRATRCWRAAARVFFGAPSARGVARRAWYAEVRSTRPSARNSQTSTPCCSAAGPRPKSATRVPCRFHTIARPVSSTLTSSLAGVQPSLRTRP